MKRTMLKSKIHRARVTEANVDYEGSLTIDGELMRRADIVAFEKVAVYNVSNGARLETYAIEGPRGGGDICLNGAAARLGTPGDLIIIATYAEYEDEELHDYNPKLVFVDEKNRAIKPKIVRECRC